MLFVFMSQPDFACNPHALYSFIKEYTGHETAWLVKSEKKYEILRDRGIRCAVYNTVESNRLLGEADYIIMNSYTFPEIPKQEGQVVANLWHGSGIKAHDYFQHEANSQHIKELEEFCKLTDLMCVHSLDDRFRLSAMLHYDMRRSYVTGQPRLDCVKSSDGRGKLSKVLGRDVSSYSHVIFYAPSFRANSSSHSGSLVSDNIFRLRDFGQDDMEAFLCRYNALLVYKLHPIEQTAFKGRAFSMGDRCIGLDEDRLFEADVRYDEILNAFDVMVSDYSSIAFDFLLLDRPLVYLVPDYEEYRDARGFVFSHVEKWMPGAKVFNFKELLNALAKSFGEPGKFHKEREFVLANRFDFLDDGSAKRAYEQIVSFRPRQKETKARELPKERMPSYAEHVCRFLPASLWLVDSTRSYEREERSRLLATDQELIYLKSEPFNPYRRLSGFSSVEIADYELYLALKDKANVQVMDIDGGVDFDKFSSDGAVQDKDRIRIGFAGTIDERIYFAMVQYICESYPDYEVVFAGAIFGKYPAWLDGYDNLRYLAAGYEELPGIIESFDVCLLPFYGRHAQYLPAELFQYLAAGKPVVASNMTRLPENSFILKCASVAEAADKIGLALQVASDEGGRRAARQLAAENDWSLVATRLLEDINRQF